MALEQKQLLLAFCKEILSSILKQKQQNQDNEKEIILNVYHEECSKLMQKISDLSGDTLPSIVVVETVRKIAQLVLDLTYVEECCLVEEEFTCQDAYQRVSHIIATLSSVEGLATSARISPDGSPTDVLSPSIAECFHWRKGALFYMYCHTLNNRLSREQLPPNFTQCLQEGSRHLISMLSTRGSPQWLLKDPTNCGANDSHSQESGDDSDMLLAQGIYSDTHLLALMYLGEMCYWYAQLASQNIAEQGNSEARKSPTNLEGKEPAVKCDPSEVDEAPPPATPARQATEPRQPASDEDCGAGQVSQQARPALSHGDSLDMITTGKLCLENYVKAAKGPMSVGGWNTNRAEEILQYFEKLTL